MHFNGLILRSLQCHVLLILAASDKIYISMMPTRKHLVDPNYVVTYLWKHRTTVEPNLCYDACQKGPTYKLTNVEAWDITRRGACSWIGCIAPLRLAANLRHKSLIVLVRFGRLVHRNTCVKTSGGVSVCELVGQPFSTRRQSCEEVWIGFHAQFYTVDSKHLCWRT